MLAESLSQNINNLVDWLETAVFNLEFVVQLSVILTIYSVAFGFSVKAKRFLNPSHQAPEAGAHTLKQLAFKLRGLIFPVVSIFLLKLSSALGQQFQLDSWLLNAAFVIAALLFLNTLIRAFVDSEALASFMRWIVLPVVAMHMLGVLPQLTAVLEEMAITVGNVEISAYGIARVLIFGTILFWLGRVSRSAGKELIKNHHKLDVTTKEVFTKVFEVALFCVVFIVLLNIMGINLTALAVFGGALGVGLGLGLQTIASTFISGIIILLDRSLTVGDFVELDDGS